MAELESLKKQRKILKQAFTRIVNFCNQPNVTCSEITVRAERADELFSKYENIQSQRDEFVPSEQMAAEEQIKASYFHIKAMPNEFRQNTSAVVEPPAPVQGNSELTQAIQAVTQNQSSMGVILERWINFNKNVAAIVDIKITRWIQYTPESTIELHGFSDASERAYAAAVYVRIHYNNQIHSHLIAAKSRVAPIKQISLPRLELCGAHLLTKLLVKVRNSLNMPNIIMHGWTDSMIVLSWLSDHPCRWKTFVANRTSQIINILPAQQWHHIPGQHNPADLATRVMDAEGLADNKLWWNGPIELNEPITTRANYHKLNTDVHLEECKEIASNVAYSD